MPGLLDVATSTRTVSVGGVDVPIPGVSAKGIAYLLERFPVFRELLTGRTPKLAADNIIAMLPDAIAAIIAAGTGYPGNREAEAKAEALPAEVQVELLEAIFAVTMPKGVGPFVERIMALAGALDAPGVAPINTPVGKSRAPSKP